MKCLYCQKEFERQKERQVTCGFEPCVSWHQQSHKLKNKEPFIAKRQAIMREKHIVDSAWDQVFRGLA